MNILKEILDRLEYERLIEEGKDPIELLHYKFSYIPSQVIDKVISIDPTKKKSYSQWLLSKWKDEKETIINNLKNDRIKKLFNHYKNHNDIQIKNCPSVEEGLRVFVPEEDTVLTKSSAPMTYIENLDEEVPSELANDFDVVYNDDDWIIAVPNTYEAECKLGENMAWCTANHFGNGESYYNNYLNQGGKYYVNFDMTQGESAKGKDYPFTRYQFHFESHQFMDKNDNPVELDSIDMPEGAKQYYISEGYDEDDFVDEEAKHERYDEWRSSHAYRLNDDLELNFSYDEDYEITEPDENTDYYVFDINDNRDPISWDEVPNPFTNEDVIRYTSKRNDFYILNKSYGAEDSYLLVIEDYQHRYRSWSAYAITKYVILPNDFGVVAVYNENRGSNYYTAFFFNGYETYNKLNAENCENIFINEACTKADEGERNRIFIEAVNSGYHSLFVAYNDEAGSENFECIIKRDFPINGEHYVINENGAIEGKYGRYRAYDDGSDDGQEYTKYDLEFELENGDYVVSTEFFDDDNREKIKKENIIKKGEKEPFLKQWVDKINGIQCGLYNVTNDGKVGYISQNGQQVGNWYKRCGILDKENGIIGGAYGDKTDLELIDAKTGNIFMNFKSMVGNPSNGKMVISTYDDGIKIYDYIKNQYCYPEFKEIKRIIPYYDDYYCTLKDGSSVIFDFGTQRITSVDLKSIEKIYSSDYIKLGKINGKFNVYDISSSKEILPQDVDEIIGAIDYSYAIVYYLNKKSYVYNYKRNCIIGNQNGAPYPTELDIQNYLNYAYGNYIIRFFLTDSKINFKDYGNIATRKTSSNIASSDVPREVLEMYYNITGEEPMLIHQNALNKQSAPSFAENVKNMFKRLDEIKNKK